MGGITGGLGLLGSALKPIRDRQGLNIAPISPYSTETAINNAENGYFGDIGLLREPNRSLAGKVNINTLPPQQQHNPMAGFGGALGLLFGLGATVVGGIARRGQQDAFARQQFDAMYKEKTVDPSYYAKKGGMVMPIGDQDGAIKVRAMRGEVAALPNGMIVDVHSTLSKKEHEGKNKDDITDLFPIGSYIGSTNKITRDAADKVILGGKAGEYTENGKDKPYKEIKLSDAFGKKKEMTTAELLKRVRTQFKTPEILEDEVYNPFAAQTAAENMAARGKYISGVLSLDAAKNKLLREQIKLIQSAQQQDQQEPEQNGQQPEQGQQQ